MTTILLLEYAIFADFFVGIGLLILMQRKRLLRDFSFLAAFLAVNCLEDGMSIALLFFRKYLGISPGLDYKIYFYSHWALFFIEYSLLLLVIYSVFRKAMKPLVGLHRAGKIVFRWVGGVSVALSLGMALGPHAAGPYFMALAGQMQQGTSILILCLLLFVCFTTRYLGLTYRSHIFGVSLGLGVFAAVGLVESAWLSIAGPGPTLYSPVYLISALGSCAALLTWGTYFAMPEPERKMVLLPTTSPFFLWNRISEALGDEPGFVAIAGFKPEMLAPAELTVMKAASNRLREREAEEAVAKRGADATKAAQHLASRQPIAMRR